MVRWGCLVVAGLWVLGCGGCKKMGGSSHIVATDIGVVETRLHLWEAEEGVRAFIEGEGWSHKQEFLHSWQFKLIATTPESDTIVFECLQERSEDVKVTIYISKNGDSGQPELTDALKASLAARYDR